MQVAALPPPDDAEANELQQELLALEACILDVAAVLKVRGCSIHDSQPPAGVPEQAWHTFQACQATTHSSPLAAKDKFEHADAALAQPSKSTGSDHARNETVAARADATKHKEKAEGCSVTAADPLHAVAGADVLASEVPASDMLDGIDRSLCDIDAVMRARGYRYATAAVISCVHNTQAC